MYMSMLIIVVNGPSHIHWSLAHVTKDVKSETSLVALSAVTSQNKLSRGCNICTRGHHKMILASDHT